MSYSLLRAKWNEIRRRLQLELDPWQCRVLWYYLKDLEECVREYELEIALQLQEIEGTER